ncbi:hypothetical protein K491DRAFT_715126 [Lophiostoma macrostomum CBS 122681]|uniref:Uncharacterized protein n=1 Tax=Lophiostoma macrostomum CBS 122681 TaxID=1314788 RepID=A0A6A6T9V5_9PLEO|nr:hypothetical protein K491DRAFT_715126 [Lophiostoma macrostomum CBS 122681]
MTYSWLEEVDGWLGLVTKAIENPEVNALLDHLNASCTKYFTNEWYERHMHSLMYGHSNAELFRFCNWHLDTQNIVETATFALLSPKGSALRELYEQHMLANKDEPTALARPKDQTIVEMAEKWRTYIWYDVEDDIDFVVLLLHIHWIGRPSELVGTRTPRTLV